MENDNFDLGKTLGTAGIQTAAMIPSLGLSYATKDYLDRVIRKRVNRFEDPMSTEDMQGILASDNKLKNTNIDLHIDEDPKFVGQYTPQDSKGNDEISIGKDYRRPSTFYHEYGHLENEKHPILGRIQRLARATNNVPYRLGTSVVSGMVNNDEKDYAKGMGKAVGVDLLAQSPHLISEAAASIRALNKMKSNHRMQAIPSLGLSFLANVAPSVVGSGITGASQVMANRMFDKNTPQ